VREFVNARVGIQTREEEHKNSLSKLEADKNSEKEEAVAAAIVFHAGRSRK
jgi:hypothetical protein